MEAASLDIQTIRKTLFTVCETRDQLSFWLRVFLGLDLPGETVSEESNSNPLDLIWVLYDKARRNDFGEISRYMAYACRGGGKTLSASALELLMVLHFGREVAHMAAILPQSQKSQEYLRGFTELPYIRDFKVGQNVKKMEFVWYTGNGGILGISEFDRLPEPAKPQYKRHWTYIQTVICNMAGANCISPSTAVTLESGESVPAYSLSPGDVVRSWHTDEHRFVNSRVAGISHSQKQACRLTFSNGGSVVVSEDHPVLCSDGWRRARALKKHHGFWLLGRDDDKSPVCFDDCSSYELDAFQVILGSLLGDSSLTWPKSPKTGLRYGRGPRLQLFRRRKQKELLWLVARALGSLGVECRISEAGNGFRLGSQVSERLIPFYQLLKLDTGRKTVTEEALSRLDTDGLAMWFMDDGSGGPEDIGSRKSKPISFATCGFTVPENQLIAARLQQLGFTSAKVQEVSNQGGNKYPVVGLSAEDSRTFSGIVWERVAPCCRYKLWEPLSFLDGFCIETGQHLSPSLSSGGGFRRCPDRNRPPSKGQRGWRQKWKNFRSLFQGKLTRIEPLGPMTLCDVVLDAEPSQQNFIANSLILLHNSAHVNGVFCVDEVDVIPKKDIQAYHQAKSIPDARNGIIPFTLLTSTRKSRIGLVQAELDNAVDTLLQALHWNIIDVTEACPASRHKPELPKARYWIKDDDVRHVTDSDYGTISLMEQSKFYAVEGFAGCEKCRLFPACKGRLATHQKGRSKFLKPIPAVLGWFIGAPHPEYITTEFLCRKPDTSGLVYPRLNRELHVKTASEMACLVAGEEMPEVVDKASLLEYLVSVGAKFATGIDFGFTHPFAAVTIAIWGPRAFVVDVVARTGLELDEKVESCQHIKVLNPTVYGDTEAPADIKTFRTRGFKIKAWSKFPGSVKAGIEVVRSKLWSLAVGPALFFLAEDPGVEFLYRQLESYAFKTDVVGDFTEDPDDDNDDGADALRYVVMNTFAKGGALKDLTSSTIIGAPGAHQLVAPQQPLPGQQSTWMQDLIRSHLEAPGEAAEPGPVMSVKNRKFSWSIE